MKKQQTTFAIGIPTINRADLLQPTLEKYCRDFPNTAIYIVDNGFQAWEIKHLPNVYFIINNVNAGVAKSWNQLLDRCYNGIQCFTAPCHNALILNDDIYLGKTELDILKFISLTEFYMAVQPGTWCSFILSKLIYKKTGPFDERFFPAYFEDNDYEYRLKLAGFPSTRHEELKPDVYRNSATIEQDPSLNSNFDYNRNYYINKWGGPPLEETYLSPFNNTDRFLISDQTQKN